ncbi:hypothetical protein DHEL01_v200583 [Diaporthe helianthi]|uniref:Rhodopsin domain-containing protein n=1 Tax=Diaporthe helianthi TaxID=158607 RepID=A0A2P5IES7_DIAHE|nr:hypothetical protein DHEL01_v200583 [Diaporthe helianthi]
MSTGNATLDAVGAVSGATTAELAIEWIVYLVLIILITALRTYARASIPGRRGFGWDDYLVWIAVVWYVILTAEVYVIGVTAIGIANDSMTNEYRAQLAKDGPGSQEFHLRVLGSKMQLAAWISYSLVLWLLKGSLLCFFVIRLTEGITGARMRGWIGTGLLVVTWVSIVITVLASCRPLNRMWQIFPDPGAICYAGVSPVLIGVTLAANVVTDIYLISIPVPVLLRASLSRVQKVSLVSLFSCSSLITAMAVVRVAVIVVNSNSNGDGAWALRECFVGMVTTNLAPIIPLFRKWLSPWLGRLETTTDGSTIRGTAAASSRTMNSRTRDPNSPGLKLIRAGRHHSSDSSEHIVDANIDVEMQSYHSAIARVTGTPYGLDTTPTGRSNGRSSSDSPTLIIQSNSEMLDGVLPVEAPRNVQVRDTLMRQRDFMNNEMI